MTLFLCRYKDTTSPISPSENPLTWWKMNQATFPLLAKYIKANGAFQATSVASERVYNIDKLVIRILTFICTHDDLIDLVGV